MELIHRTFLKKMNPKKGFTALYIRFPWGYDRALIGKSVSIYKVDDGYFLSTESNEFKPPNKVEANQEEVCSMNNECKQKESLKSRKNTLESQISELNKEIEKSRVQTIQENQIAQNYTQKKNVSGRSKPPFVLAAFSSAPYPGGYRTIHWPCSGLHPQGFVVPTYPVPQTLSELLARLPVLLA